MATASKTWVFAADAEGLADVGDSGTLGSAWSATDGNPAGDLEWQTGAGGSQSERARKAGGTSWATLFNIPANATVTDIQVTGWDEISFISVTRQVRLRFVDASGTTVHSAGELFDTGSGTPTNNAGAAVAKGAGTSRAVDASFQAASTAVSLEIAVTVSGGCDLEQDNIAVTVTYSTAVAAGVLPLPTFAAIRFNG